ncbi:MAG: OsmC family protein [Magnetococcales bacterium]|nr:OsmC family protein [Magnetococcales bacterium]NGZ26986.1 OsmC family protein [Magnetococcales bacterium]
MAEVTARIKLVDGMQMVGETGSGHALIMDGPPHIGGANTGPRPMELLLVGMGGCTTIDVVDILKKGRHQVSGCEVLIKGIRAETEPKVYVTIGVHYIVKGRELPPAAVERAIKLSEDKYCSASAMLGKTATIQSTYEIIEG